MIISNTVLTAEQFAQYYSGKAYFQCGTFEETRKCLASDGIYIARGYRFTELDRLKPDGKYVIVSFCREDDFTRYEYYIMYVQKKYLKRFLHNMQTAT